jgi:phosphohistidine phosphatase
VVSSSALRALQTADLAAGGAGYSKKARAEPLLYENKAEGYLDVLRRLPPRSSRVLLVGHNPALREAAAALLGCLPESFRLPPAALACLEASAEEWARLEPGTCTLQWLVSPELTAASG